MSISRPIKISYEWNEENFQKALKNSYNHQYKNSARRYIGWFFVAMAQFGVVATLKGGNIGLLMLSTILIFYWYVAKKWFVANRAKKEFDSSPLKDKIVALEINDKGIKQDDSFVDWEEIQGVVPIEDDILLYYKNRAFYIPSAAFESLEDKSSLKSLAKEKGRLFHV